MNEENIPDLLGYRVSTTQWYMRTLFNKCIKEAGLKLTPEQWGLLKIVEAEPGISQTEIARRGLKDKTNVTRMIDLLEKYGHMERRPDAADRRAYRVYLTPLGKKDLKTIYKAAQKANEMAAAGLSEPELNLLKQSLEKVCRTIQDKI